MKYTSFREIKKLIPPGGYTVDYPLPAIPGFIHEEEEALGLQLNPDFQRGHVWTKEQQIAYIEFLLRDGRSGRDIYLNCPSWRSEVPQGAYNDFVCVDGLQRLTAVIRFIQNEIPAFSTLFKDFEGPKSLLDNTLHINVNSLPTKADVLEWYLEMNSGGTPHTKSEITRVSAMLRNAIWDTLSTEGQNILEWLYDIDTSRAQSLDIVRGSNSFTCGLGYNIKIPISDAVFAELSEYVKKDGNIIVDEATADHLVLHPVSPRIP